MASSSILTSLLQSLPSSRFSFRINSANFSIGSCNPLLGLLETKLADKLELLKLQDDHEVGSSYLSARWLSRAMAVVLSTNSSIKAFVPDLEQALSEQGNLCKWLDESLDDTIRLLDACQILQETVAGITAHHSIVKLVLELISLDKPANEATLRRVRHALSKSRKISQKRNLDVNPPKRSKLETCGSMLRRMGEKLHNIDDAAKGKALGAMYAAQITTILICGVLITALSINQRRSSISTMSIATQSNWSLALSSLQQKVKEQVERKKSKNQRMPYLEELENVDSSLHSLEDLINQALQAHQFPMDMEIEEPIKQTIGNLRRFSDELGDGLGHLERNISELYQVLITSRMMLLDIYPKSSSIPR